MSDNCRANPSKITQPCSRVLLSQSRLTRSGSEETLIARYGREERSCCRTTVTVVPAVPIMVFSDGACSGNPGPGGWGWAVINDGPYGSGSAAQTTNQRMEIMAAFDAVRTLGEGTDVGIEVVSDSTYVVNCFRDRWWDGWIKRGWRNAAKQPVANRDLWEPFVDLVRSRAGTSRAVGFRWVRGHSGDPMNERVDRLAVAACSAQSPRTIVGLSSVLSAATTSPDHDGSSSALSALRLFEV